MSSAAGGTPETASTRKPIFDAVRRILGRGFRRSEINQLDRAFDGPDPDEKPEPAETNADTAPTAIGPAGIALIKQFEGCASLRKDGMVEAYPNPASGGDPWTIGWGATGAGIAPGVVWSKAKCDARLEQDLERYSAGVRRALKGAPATQAQFDALVSFHYNTGAIAKATLTRRHREGNYAAAAFEFSRWNKAAGRVLKGLTRRRAAEAELYRSGPSNAASNRG